MAIKKLPQHLINKLKAGEIVERPASVVKELLENALDAGATRIDISIEQGGKQLIKVTDNGSWIEREDMELTIERYATSKITSENDLENINSYGFRGEALASISEVSSFRIQSKQKWSAIWNELWRDGERYNVKEISYADEHGTSVFVQDIFHAIPAREKFLKTDATERQYISKIFIDYALAHTDKHWTLTKDGKQVWNLPPADSLMTRVLQVTKPEWEGNLKPLAYQDEQVELWGLAGDASLHFTSTQYLHIFVNGRPVEDKLIKRAVMQAYERQIVPWTYPFAILFVKIHPSLVDVNVHPRKSEVKFLDPGSMFSLVEMTIKQSIGEMKVNYAAFRQLEVKQTMSADYGRWNTTFADNRFWGVASQNSFWNSAFSWAQQSNVWGFNLFQSTLTEYVDDNMLVLDQQPVRLVGQLWNMYITLENEQYLYLVDQHALAERVAFEQMKAMVKKEWFVSEILLHPLTISHPNDVEAEELLERLREFWFDASLFGNNKIIIHAIPQVFAIYQVNIELLFNQLRWAAQKSWEAPAINFDVILDAILGMKACKASIKAGQKLQLAEMAQLIKDWSNYIPGMFVCQHGRPSIVKIEKNEIDNFFAR